MTDKPKVEKNRKRGREKGCEKTGGRQKGTPNKNSSAIRNALDELGFNVIQEFVEAYQMLEPSQRLQEVKFIMAFMYPKLSEVSQAPEIPNGNQFNRPSADLLKVINGSK